MIYFLFCLLTILVKRNSEYNKNIFLNVYDIETRKILYHNILVFLMISVHTIILYLYNKTILLYLFRCVRIKM